MVKNLAKAIFVIFLCQVAHSQVTEDCGGAIPICNNTPINGGTNGFGVDDFSGASSSGCLEQTTSGAIESNSGWYRFRTAASGQLGFNIGHDSNEDWDFALYRSSDCTNLGEPIRCNFFDNSDHVSFIGVGVDPTGDANSVHYEDWLEVNSGEDYILFINNFSNINSGFSIQFTGDIWTSNPNTALDCSIVNNLLGSPISACEGESVTLDATTIGATGYEWYRDDGIGFQLVTGESNATLNVTSSATYRVVVITGTGAIVSDVQVGFNVSPTTEVMSDVVFCHSSDMIFDLEAIDYQALGIQSPDEFIVSYHATQSDADLGINPLSKQYAKSPGQEIVYVRTTSLANPNCYDASQSFLLDAIETPELTFSQEVVICESAGSIIIGETMPNPNYTYLWSTGESTPSISVSDEGEYTLTVSNTSNGMSCDATRTVATTISNIPEITAVDIDGFKASNTVTIEMDITGDFEYRLDDGEYQSSNVLTEVLPGEHTVYIRDTQGCGEIARDIVVVGFPAIFSPNGDVLNESWQIEGLSELNSPIVTIYDRYGKLIKQMTEFSGGWDGSFNGRPLPSTDYWFKLSYLDSAGNRVFAKYLQSHFSLRR